MVHYNEKYSTIYYERKIVDNTTKTYTNYLINIPSFRLVYEHWREEVRLEMHSTDAISPFQYCL